MFLASFPAFHALLSSPFFGQSHFFSSLIHSFTLLLLAVILLSAHLTNILLYHNFSFHSTSLHNVLSFIPHFHALSLTLPLLSLLILLRLPVLFFLLYMNTCAPSSSFGFFCLPPVIAIA